jgi:hypothetical protein
MESDSTVSSKSDDDDDAKLLDAAEMLCVASCACLEK